MKFTLFATIFSLVSFSFAAPVTGVNIKTVTGLGNSMTATAGAPETRSIATAGAFRRGINIRRDILAVDSTDAAVDAHSAFGSTPLHTNDRHNVQTVESVFIPIEAHVRVLVAKLSSKSITINKAKTVIPQLITHLLKLQTQLKILAGVKVDVKNLPVHIQALIDMIFNALNNDIAILGAEDDILEPLIAGVGVAIQGVLDVAVRVSAGLDDLRTVDLKPLIALSEYTSKSALQSSNLLFVQQNLDASTFVDANVM